MPEEPYRPTPRTSERDVELARLAAAGQSRILGARANETTARQEAEERNREKNLRVGLGGYYGSPVRVASVVLIALGALLSLGEIVWDIDGFSLGEVTLVGAMALLVFAAPKATRARVGAEREWASSLPFAMAGYFEILGGEPRRSCVLTVTLAWRDPRAAVGAGTLQGLVGLLDTGARAESRDAARALIRSGPIVDRAWIRINRTYYVHRNTELVRYVHRLVDQVLLPLHRSHAIARVSWARA